MRTYRGWLEKKNTTFLYARFCCSNWIERRTIDQFRIRRKASNNQLAKLCSRVFWWPRHDAPITQRTDDLNDKTLYFFICIWIPNNSFLRSFISEKVKLYRLIKYCFFSKTLLSLIPSEIIYQSALRNIIYCSTLVSTENKQETILIAMRQP